MDASRLYEQFLEWDKHKDPLWAEKPDSGRFVGGKIVRVGRDGVSIIPEENPSHIVKIVHPGRKPRGLSVEDEFALSVELGKISGEGFVTPLAVSFGHSPDFLEMVLIEGTPPSGDTNNLSEITKIGAAVGELQALLVEKFGAIHKDICNSNLLLCGDKVAVLDVASIVPLRQAGFLETMFLPTLAAVPDYSPTIAQEFERRSGKKVNCDVLRALLPWAETMFAKETDKPEKAIRNLFANFEKWDAQRKLAGNAAHPLDRKNANKPDGFGCG